MLLTRTRYQRVEREKLTDRQRDFIYEGNAISPDTSFYIQKKLTKRDRESEDFICEGNGISPDTSFYIQKNWRRETERAKILFARVME